MNLIQHALFLVILSSFHVLYSTNVSALENEVIFETNKGSFTLELFPQRAPETVANFLTYVDEGYYTDTIFHRVINDFVIQGGGFKKGITKGRIICL